MTNQDDMAVEAADAIRARTSLTPRIGLILGSGLATVGDELAVEARVPTATIPHFPRSTVAGHAGEVAIGDLAGKTVAILSGRVHGYEGYSAAEVGFSVRVLYLLGCRYLIVTNAAGSLHPDFRPGDVMIVEDHISFPSLAGNGPLVGIAPPPDTTRFVDLTDAYSPGLRSLAERVAAEAGITLRRGVYAMVGGPNFETPAEVRFLRMAGGDAVGMSTVPEVIVARQLGMHVLGLSVMSNVAAGLPGALLGHEDVLAVVARSAPIVGRIVRGIVTRLGA